MRSLDPSGGLRAGRLNQKPGGRQGVRAQAAEEGVGEQGRRGKARPTCGVSQGERPFIGPGSHPPARGTAADDHRAQNPAPGTPARPPLVAGPPPTRAPSTEHRGRDFALGPVWGPEAPPPGAPQTPLGSPTPPTVALEQLSRLTTSRNTQRRA